MTVTVSDRIHGVPRSEWDAHIERLAQSRVEQGKPRHVEDPDVLKRIAVLARDYSKKWPTTAPSGAAVASTCSAVAQRSAGTHNGTSPNTASSCAEQVDGAAGVPCASDRDGTFGEVGSTRHDERPQRPPLAAAQRSTP